MASKWDVFALSERMMGMDDATWERHANPWSVYSRMSILPLMTAAVLSRVWLGWWALVPITLVVLWTWWNPRAFGAPKTANSWAAHGTFGERVFLNRAKVPIPSPSQTLGHCPQHCVGFGPAPMDLGSVAVGSRHDPVWPDALVWRQVVVHRPDGMALSGYE